MAPRAVVPAARPISWPEKCNCCPSQVPSVTYQAPQIKYSRNIITDKRNRICKITRFPVGKATHTRIRTKTSRSTRGGLAARGTIEPRIDGLFHARRRLIRHRDLAAFAGGGIARVERLHHNETVFSGGLRSFFAARATREVRQFLRRAVIPELFEYGVGPTFCGRRFFDGVAVAVFAECGQRVAHIQRKRLRLRRRKSADHKRLDLPRIRRALELRHAARIGALLALRARQRNSASHRRRRSRCDASALRGLCLRRRRPQDRDALSSAAWREKAHRSLAQWSRAPPNRRALSEKFLFESLCESLFREVTA